MIISPEGTKRPVSTKAGEIVFQRAGVTHIEEGVSDAPLRAAFVELKQSGPYGTAAAGGDAPAFSGNGATQKLDNERITVWEFAQRPAPSLHRHTRDAVVVDIDGQSPRATWVAKGSVHRDEGSGNASLIYVFEIK